MEEETKEIKTEEEEKEEFDEEWEDSTEIPDTLKEPEQTTSK